MINCIKTGRLAQIRLNSPPVNALGTQMRALFLSHLTDALNDQEIEAVLIGSELDLFCGGADIHEFRNLQLWGEPELPYLCQVIDDAPKLIVSCINGVARGGAVELSLACHYRIARCGASLGLPEIKLGLLPGAGGTQRLPRVTNLKVAADMILSGEPLNAVTAFERGLVDRLIADEDDFAQASINFVEDLLDQDKPRVSCSEIEVGSTEYGLDYLNETRLKIESLRHDHVAALRCLRSLEAACTLPLQAGLTQERSGFIELLKTSQARARIHLFFAERDARKIPGITPTVKARTISAAAVIGAGTMGTGITIALLEAGIQVSMMDASMEKTTTGLQIVRNHFDRCVKKKRLTEELAASKLALLSAVDSYAQLSTFDLVVEAVDENLDLKKSVFIQLDSVCKPEAILASNTSTLNLNCLAEATSRPESVIGLHFFSPAHIMQLIEIVRGGRTSSEVLKTAMVLAARLGKVSVVAQVGYGFIGNRMFEPYFRESARLLLEGASAAQIDRVHEEFGMAMGAISVADLAGIDIGYFARAERPSEFVHDEAYAAIHDRLFHLGRLGQKSGRGVYLYNGREKRIDPEFESLSESIASGFGIERRTISDTEILERTLYSMINEGYALLEEEIAYRAGDCDIAWVRGYGFPEWRGGPMHYASEIGPAEVLAVMKKYQAKLGNYGKHWFKPSLRLLREAGG